MDAAAFLERELDAPRADVATVVFHSIFVQYLTEGVRRRITAAIDQAVSRGTADAPVHHLAMEPDEGAVEIRLDGELLATSNGHGAGIRWLAS